MRGRGRLITLEGIEGAGKSTQLALVAQRLEETGIDALTTREPGGSLIGERIRALLLDSACQGMAASTELLLVFAARCEHLEQTIRPALEQGTWVVCDRFTDATYAYQGGGRGVERERIAFLEDFVQGAMRPDLTLLFDLRVSTGLSRAGKRSQPDRFESEERRFFEDVRAAYLEIASRCPERVRLIDAELPAEQVSDQVSTHIAAFVDGIDG